MLILLFFALLSGIVTILSPCILPVLPIVLSGSVGGKRKPLGIIAGFIGSFTIFTLLLSSVVQALQIPPDTLRIAAVSIIIIFGMVLLVPGLQKWFELLTSRLSGKKGQQSRTGFFGGLSIGASLGLVWTPCVGPIIASVISLAISQQVSGGPAAVIFAYSIGTALPMFAVMKGGRRLIQRFPALSRNTGKLQRGFGLIMIIAGLSIGLGLDRKFQTAVLEVFPGYGTGLTAFEQNESVTRALAENLEKNSQDNPQQLNWQNPPENGELADFGPAPEIMKESIWFNSTSLSMQQLRGKVVLIDFWTYSCVNCVRTLPYLQSWYETYKDQGFEIIGVHSPEFTFERDPENVKKAISDLEVTWPVVLDNGFDLWKAYKNRFWPAHYFIDARGNIRYFHFGEEEYDTGEEVIRTLLKEAGQRISSATAVTAWRGIESSTDETYLGFGRSRGFISPGTGEDNSIQQYSIPEPPGNGEWGLEGKWNVQRQYIEPVESGALELGFEAKNVFLVIEPVADNSSIRIFLDGKQTGTVHLDSSRMYQLINGEEASAHLLRLETEGGMRLYAFTFG